MKKLTIAQIKEIATEAVMGREYMQSVKDTLRTRGNAVLDQLCTGNYTLVISKKNGGVHVFIWKCGQWI